MSPDPHCGARSAGDEIKTTPRSRWQIALRTFIMLVGGCGVLGWIAYAVWEQNRPGRAAIRAMQSRNSSERRDAIDALQFDGPGDCEIAIPLLVAALGDADVKVRAAAAAALGRIGTGTATAGTQPEALRTAILGLLGAIRDPDPDVRNAAVIALGFVAGSNGEAIAALVARLLGDRDAEVRLAALGVLAAISRQTEVDPPKELVAALEDQSAGNRATAVTALTGFRRGLDPSIPTLFRILEHDEEQVRAACAHALERVGPPAISATAVPALIVALHRPDRRLRAVACSVLMHLGAEARAAVPALIAVAREKRGDLPNSDHAAEDLGNLAIQALGRIAPGTDSAGEAVAALTEILRAQDASQWGSAVDALESFGQAAAPAIPELVRALRKSFVSGQPFIGSGTAATALGKIAPGTPLAGEAIAALVESLRAGPPDVQGHAADALADFGPAAAPAIPELVRMLQDPSDPARWSYPEGAARALGLIAPGTASSDEVFAALSQALQAKSGRTRSAAIHAFVPFGPKAATVVPRIRALAKDPDASVRWAAQTVLPRLVKE
jgi:HEAT repeat protein